MKKRPDDSTVKAKTGLPKLAPGKRGGYIAILRGPRTDKMLSTGGRKAPPTVDRITGIAKVELDEATIFYSSVEKVRGVKAFDRKLFDFCLGVFAKQNHYRGADIPDRHVAAPLEDFMKARGTPMTKASKDEIRNRVIESIDLLVSLAISGCEKRNGRVERFAKMNLFTSGKLDYGNIEFSFSPEIALYLVNSYILHLPANLFKLDERNDNAYSLGRRIVIHSSIDENRLKGTADIISVVKLLEWSPGIPSYDEVMRTGRQLEQRIIRPLEKTLDALWGVVHDGWEYCKSKKAPLTEKGKREFDYSVFKECYIIFKLRDVPERLPRLQRKTKKRRKKS